MWEELITTGKQYSVTRNDGGMGFSGRYESFARLKDDIILLFSKADGAVVRIREEFVNSIDDIVGLPTVVLPVSAEHFMPEAQQPIGPALESPRNDLNRDTVLPHRDVPKLKHTIPNDSIMALKNQFDHKNIHRIEYRWPNFDHIKTRIKLNGTKNDVSDWAHLYQSFQYAIKQGEISFQTRNEDRIRRLLQQSKELYKSTGVDELIELEALLYYYSQEYEKAVKVLCVVGKVTSALEIWSSMPFTDKEIPELSDSIKTLLSSDAKIIACLLSKYAETAVDQWLALSRRLVDKGIQLSIICYVIASVLRVECNLDLDDEVLIAKADDSVLEQICALAKGTTRQFRNGYVFEWHEDRIKIIDDTGRIIKTNRSTSFDNKFTSLDKAKLPISVTFSIVKIDDQLIASRLHAAEQKDNEAVAIQAFLSITEQYLSPVEKDGDVSKAFELLRACCQPKKISLQKPLVPPSPTPVLARIPHNLPRTLNSAYNQAKTIHEAGNTLRRLGNETEASLRFSKAEGFYLEAVRQHDQFSVSAAKDLVSFYQQMRRFEDALNFMQANQVLLSKDPTSYRNILHTIYLNLKDYQKCLQVALELYAMKQTTTLQTQIGYYYNKLSNPENAIRYWRSALSNASCSITQRYNILQMLGLLYVRMREISNAEAVLNQLKAMPNSQTAYDKIRTAISNLNAGVFAEDTIDFELANENDIETMEDESVDVNDYELQLLRHCDFDGIPGSELQQGETGLRYWIPQSEEALRNRINTALRDARKGAVNLGTRSKRTLTAARCYKDWYDKTRSQYYLVKYSQFLSESLFFRAQKEISIQNTASNRDFVCFLLRESIIFLSKSVTSILQERDFWEAVGCILFIKILGRGQAPYDPNKESYEKYLYNCLFSCLSQKPVETLFELTWIDRCLAYSPSHGDVRKIILSSIRRHMRDNKDSPSLPQLIKLLGEDPDEMEKNFSIYVELYQQEYVDAALFLQRICSEVHNNHRNPSWIESTAANMRQLYENSQLELLDRQRISTCIRLIELLGKTNNENDYDLHLRNCNQAIESSIKLSSDILNEDALEKSTPTALSLQSTRILALRLHHIFLTMKEDIYRRYEPELKITDMLEAEGTVISPSGEVFIQLYIKNGISCTAARDINIEFIVNDEAQRYYSMEERDRVIKLSDSLQQNSGASIQTKAILTRHGLEADALQLSFTIDFNTITGETRRIPKDIDQQFDSITIRLKSDTTFVPIENPYVTGNPVSGNLFFGRETEVDRISQMVHNGTNGQTYVIYGQMRTGKTSLLNAIENRLREMGCLIVKAPAANGVENIHGYVLEMMKALRNIMPADLHSCIDMPEADNLWQHPAPLSVLTSVFINLRDSASFAGVKLVFTCDEFQSVYSHIIHGRFPSNFMSVWKRWMHEISAFSAILVGNDAMHKFIEKYSNDFAALNTLRITYLDKPSSEKLIKEPILWKDDGLMKNRYIYNSLDRIFKLTYGSAFHIQHICYRIVSRMNYETHQNSITEDDVNAATIKLFTEVDYHSLFHMLYQSGEHELFPENSISDDDNKLLLDILARLRRTNRPATLECITSYIHEENIKLQSPIDRIISDLLIRGVIAKFNDEFFIIIELYYEHLKWREELKL